MFRGQSTTKFFDFNYSLAANATRLKDDSAAQRPYPMHVSAYYNISRNFVMNLG